MSFVIEAPGMMASVQDLGRPGYARLGVSRGGAADRGALRLANRLVGNPEDAAGIEVTAGGFRAYAERGLLLAVTGAVGPVRIGERAVGTNAPETWRHGESLEIGAPTASLRSYLGVAGGVATTVVLGSRSYSRLGDLGAPLSAGERVPVGRAPGKHPVVEHAAVPPPATCELTLAATLGPRAGWFDEAARATLLAESFTVTGELDRTGIRLDGPAIHRMTDAELPSEGMMRGAVQIPAGGRPIIFLSDHPATGGYPVPLVLTPAAADAAAQLVPGMSVRFALCG